MLVTSTIYITITASLSHRQTSEAALPPPPKIGGAAADPVVPIPTPLFAHNSTNKLTYVVVYGQSIASVIQAYYAFLNELCIVEGTGSPYSITDRGVPELIPVLGSQPAGDVSHKPCGRLSLLSVRPAVTLATLKRVAINFAVW